MMTDYSYLGTLLGRLFLISTVENILLWNGDQVCTEHTTDYDRIEEFSDYKEIACESAGIGLLTKSTDLNYLLFVSMSTKVEVFKKQDRVLLLDGLFYNQSWDYSKPISPILIDETQLTLPIHDTELVILDAVFDGNSIIRDKGANNSVRNEFDSYVLVSLLDGDYKVKSIEAAVLIKNETVSLKGIEITMA